MAKRKVAGGRRSMVAVVLIGFVLVTTGVIARRVYGVRQQRSIQQLEATRDGLAAQRIRLEIAIRDASSRAHLQPIAEGQLNMRIPKPDQQVYLKRSASATHPPTSARHDSL